MNAALLQQFVGKNIFDKCERNPWYGKVHNTMFPLYFGFMATFGIASVADNIECLPLNDTLADELNDAKSSYASDYCEDDSRRWDPNMRIFVWNIGMLLFLFVVDGVSDVFSSPSLDTFAEARKIFSELPHKTKSGSSLFKKFLEDPTEKELRKVVCFLRQERGDIVTSQWVRDLILLLGTFASTTSICIFVPNVMETFACDVEFKSSSKDEILFNCVRSWALNHNVMSWVWHIIVAVHTIIRAISYFKTTARKRNVQKLANSLFPSSASFLFIADLHQPFKKDDLRFNEFVTCLMSRTTGSSGFDRILSSIGNKTDAFLSQLLPQTTDAQNTGPSTFANDETIPFALTQSESGLDAEKLASNKLWKWVVHLLERNSAEVGVSDLLKSNQPDDKGNSLLFYALNRKPNKKFNLRAAKKILQHTKILHHHGMKMSAKEFVQDQFFRDSAYPERLKKQLLEIIEANEEGTSS